MGSFSGFDPNGFMLLELNRFNDNRDFYESVKEDIKQMSIIPMRQLASDLSDELYKIDSKMNLIPTKMVSRVRRDTRRSKNKEMYRANLWCMFMRDKYQYENMPCMWFEFYPENYSYGIGTFRVQPAFFERFREKLRTNQKEFRKALKSIEITGAVCELVSYKKDKPGIEDIDEDLRVYYNAKSFHFIYFDTDISKLVDGSIKEELTYALRAFAPMYKFLISICDDMIKNGE